MAYGVQLFYGDSGRFRRGRGRDDVDDERGGFCAGPHDDDSLSALQADKSQGSSHDFRTTHGFVDDYGIVDSCERNGHRPINEQLNDRRRPILALAECWTRKRRNADPNYQRTPHGYSASTRSGSSSVNTRSLPYEIVTSVWYSPGGKDPGQVTFTVSVWPGKKRLMSPSARATTFLLAF